MLKGLVIDFNCGVTVDLDINEIFTLGLIMEQVASILAYKVLMLKMSHANEWG